MSLINGGIEKLRAFELPFGIWADGVIAAEPRTVLVKWRSSWSDKFYQVYVNGQYAGSTLETGQREMIVQVPTSLEAPVRIEVFAVEAKGIYRDFSEEVEFLPADSGRVKISLLRSQNLPIDSAIQIYFDNGTGEIDYENSLTVLPIRVWPMWQDKAGFGMSRFGVSDFGYDSSAAVGFGKGVFGRGEFGLDADTIEWLSPSLQAGVYKFTVKVTDRAGNQSSGSETGSVTVVPAARPAERVSISSFDKQTNQLVLSVS